MRNSWIVKTFEYVIRRTGPLSTDVFPEPYIWINSKVESVFVLFGSLWQSIVPNRIINTASGNIYVIDNIDAVISGPADEGLLFIDRDDVKFIDRDKFIFIDRT